VAKYCPNRQKNSFHNVGSKLSPTQNSQKASHVFVNTTNTNTNGTQISADTTNQEAVALHVNVDNTPKIQSFVHISETSVVKKPFQHTNVSYVHYDSADLSYLNVDTDGIQHPVKALHDSGAQILVIHPDVIKDILPNLPREDTVKLKGLFGDAINADLISLTIR